MMARHQTSPIGILRLPVELLHHIASLICTPDLRRLGRVNRAFYCYVADYLFRYRYNSGLLALPNELILEVVQHVACQNDRSHLARTSQRFYPLIMNYIIRHDVQHQGSSLLIHAAEKNLKGLARGILSRGGDVNAKVKVRFGAEIHGTNPLGVAASRGNEGMVKLLIKAGANHGRRLALASAIIRRHETIAILLSQEMDPSEVLLHKHPLKSKLTALQMACVMKLVKLVRYFLLKHGVRYERDESGKIRELNVALYAILKKDDTEGDFVKRRLHEEVYQIATALLQHGANPDALAVRAKPPVSIRDVGSRHPDPRVRVLFTDSTLAPCCKESDLKIGRHWLDFSEDTAPDSYDTETNLLPSEVDRSARLSDYLERPTSETPDLKDEDDAEHTEMDSDRQISSPYNLVDNFSTPRSESVPMQPPSLSSFPQLGKAAPSAQSNSKDFWAKTPAQVFRRPVLLQTPGPSTPVSTTQKAKRPEKQLEINPFPRLGNSVSTMKNPGVNIWANFANGGVSHGTSGTRPKSPAVTTPVQKTSKKKKWAPLAI